MTTPFDSARVLDAPEAVEEYLADLLVSECPQVVAYALDVAARASAANRIPIKDD